MSKLLRQRVISKAKDENDIEDIVRRDESTNDLPSNHTVNNSTPITTNLQSNEASPLIAKQIPILVEFQVEKTDLIEKKRGGGEKKTDVNKTNTGGNTVDNGLFLPKNDLDRKFASSDMNTEKNSSKSIVSYSVCTHSTNIIGGKSKGVEEVETVESICLEDSKIQKTTNDKFRGFDDAQDHTIKKTRNSEKTMSGKKKETTAKKRTSPPSHRLLNSGKNKRGADGGGNSNPSNKRSKSNNVKSKGSSSTNNSTKQKGSKVSKKEENKKNNNETTATIVNPRTIGSNDGEGDDSSPNQQDPPPKSNVYDAMLGECRGLLHAAHEAQALGRIKMASTYLLLLHARLVGLGKRFDRCGHPLQLRISNNNNQNNISMKSISNNLVKTSDMTRNQTEESVPISTLLQEDPLPQNNDNYEQKSPVETEPQKQNRASVESSLEKTEESLGADVSNSRDSHESANEAAHALAKVLPSDIHLDNTMMEHLARAAMELHNKRTGRKSTKSNTSKKNDSCASNQGGSVVWTEQEKLACRTAAEKYGSQNIPQIMKAMKTHRTEAQVRAHLRNTAGKTAKMKQFAGEVMTVEEVRSTPLNNNSNFNKELKKNNDNTKSNNKRTSKSKSKPKANSGSSSENKSTANGSNSAQDYTESNNNVSTKEDSPNPPTKRGGRFKKPPSRATHTVVNASFDARAMLMGKPKR